jgi:hypothetical protein
MKKSIGIALLAAVAVSCVSLTPGGAKVRVYQADVDSPEAPAPPLPDGCRLLGSSGPIEELQEALEKSDPYRVQRNETAALGGNVLYLRSYLFQRLMKTDCPVGDTSPGCMSNAQNWYRVTFQSYACDTGAIAELAESPVPVVPGVFRFTLKKKTPTPVAEEAPAPRHPEATPAGADALKAKVLALLNEGVGTEVILAYVRANRPATALTADEIIDWKKSGISDEVIRATFPN